MAKIYIRFVLPWSILALPSLSGVRAKITRKPGKENSRNGRRSYINTGGGKPIVLPFSLPSTRSSRRCCPKIQHRKSRQLKRKRYTNSGHYMRRLDLEAKGISKHGCIGICGLLQPGQVGTGCGTALVTQTCLNDIDWRADLLHRESKRM